MKFTGRGFTLVELLVVIGIIAMLIAMLLPSLRKARDAAITVKCLGQMRQMGIINIQYCQDYNGMLFPTRFPDNTTVTPTITGSPLPTILQKYFQRDDGSRSIWVCPAAAPVIQATSQFPLTYGCNQGVHPIVTMDGSNFLYWQRPPAPLSKQYSLKKITQIKRHSEVVQIADGSLSSGAYTTTGQLSYTDSHYSEMYDPSKGNDPIDKLGGWSWTPNTDKGGANYHMRYRHNGEKYGNALFLDGHAGTYEYNDQTHQNVGLRNRNFATGY